MHVTHVYVCKSCKKEFDDHNDAVYCCTNDGFYKCGSCQILYKARILADDCCRQQPKRHQYVRSFIQNNERRAAA